MWNTRTTSLSTSIPLLNSQNYSKIKVRVSDHRIFWYWHLLVDWDSMKDTLRDYMEIVRAYIKRKERKDLIWKRREYAALAWFDYRMVECDPGTFLPNQIDIWLWSPVKDIIEQPSEIEVTKDSFEHAFRGLPAFTNAWQTDKLEQLVRVANNNLKWLSFPEANDLERATCVFSCSNDFQHNLMGCYQEDESCIMWFPEFIYHRCNSLSRRRWGDKDETITDLDSCQSLSAESEASGFRRRQWSTRWLFFDDKASRTVKNILTACRMPLSTRVQHLDREDPRLVCLKCSFGAKCDGERVFSVMTWRTAVRRLSGKANIAFLILSFNIGSAQSEKTLRGWPDDLPAHIKSRRSWGEAARSCRTGQANLSAPQSPATTNWQAVEMYFVQRSISRERGTYPGWDEETLY